MEITLGKFKGLLVLATRFSSFQDYPGRRKKPELEHYKPPGAFTSARRHDEPGRDDYENRKFSDSDRSGSRGGRAQHSGRSKNQHPVCIISSRLGVEILPSHQMHAFLSVIHCHFILESSMSSCSVVFWARPCSIDMIMVARWVASLSKIFVSGLERLC